ncbi:slr0845 [Synechocystis sp. PCC 6803]|uniref:Slr0845 protein n=1 Tax=Synechocystis sp. (strain ATCC 27184 / PCC 6803 / Kazusa) TaxID=1111708 RepID=Q55430_SYNY3|nr:MULTISPECIES: hypothetical protein [unclassified Synechocystis]BAM53872.1 hypothetical protein BEST7613_4941 [Synechocystis sp. PCC 6803] [Bacillus subtilis BEST7613]AGF52824.1 hypothetical protein MYO_125950 [Synechocystis sp. PCC 6803]ALJ68730.1 hypothetical protein AOY38_13345 [Synechocystis sp. PCC 6803]AVP90587.1 hypothetical protein C7I86_13455 [Synechocystis sp. IPPAS B-1465]MBD2616660.1 hypothetical protein [Synechocystis sp. FACHB-898]
MSGKKNDYDALLADFTDREGAIALLRQHRPYLEKLPSLRRPERSIITIPLPIVRLRHLPLNDADQGGRQTTPLAKVIPCDLAILMCDPEWQVKLGSEILVFIHRPEENFSDLLSRWRRSQIYLDQDYEWLMPPQEKHMFSEAAEEICPLFIIFEQTPHHIQKGLAGAGLPFVLHSEGNLTMAETLELISE